jgi:uncharacterized protein (TIGR00159 family)
MPDGLARFWAGLTMRDAIVAFLDIFIVYYGIYRVLLLIKGTRAAQMVFGLVLIAAGFFAAKRFELATVSWLLDNFINYFIIIIIVVFQNDIRRGLVRIGQNLFSFGRTYEETHVFDEVIRAVEHMGRARIGSLIVFQREADLSEFVETGQVLDAQVSKELLVALFLPSRDNELHDGAVVIHNLRVQQGGAVLPLSRNPHLSRELGTRHRAAIGITEETDAVSIVVSEERGEISLCFNGNIARDLDSATLRKALLGLFHKQKDDRTRVADEARGAAAAARAVAAFAAVGSMASAAGVGADTDDSDERVIDDERVVPAPAPAAATSAAAASDPVARLGTASARTDDATESPDPPPMHDPDDGNEVVSEAVPRLDGGTIEDEWPAERDKSKKNRAGTEYGP